MTGFRVAHVRSSLSEKVRDRKCKTDSDTHGNGGDVGGKETVGGRSGDLVAGFCSPYPAQKS